MLLASRLAPLLISCSMPVSDFVENKDALLLSEMVYSHVR